MTPEQRAKALYDRYETELDKTSFGYQEIIDVINAAVEAERAKYREFVKVADIFRTCAGMGPNHKAAVMYDNARKELP